MSEFDDAARRYFAAARAKIAEKIIPPSAFVFDEMTAREWTLADLSEKSGLSIERLTKLLDQNEHLEQEDAECLGMAFDVAPALFTNLQRAYDAKARR